MQNDELIRGRMEPMGELLKRLEEESPSKIFERAGLGISHPMYTVEFQERLAHLVAGVSPFYESQAAISNLVQRATQLNETIKRLIEAGRALHTFAASVQPLDYATVLASTSDLDILVKRFGTAAQVVKLDGQVSSLQAKVFGMLEPTLPLFHDWWQATLESSEPILGISSVLPLRERVLSTQLAEDFEIPAPEFLQKQILAPLVEEIDAQLLITLSEALHRLNPEFFKLWEGAVVSAQSSNPDKIRHATVSARELLNKVIATLAPDVEFAKWPQSSKYSGKKGRMREGKLQFIYSRIRNNDR